MLFNSSAFLAFYVVFFPAYWAIHRNIPARNALILIGSYIFYGSWDWRFLSLILIWTPPGLASNISCFGKKENGCSLISGLIADRISVCGP